VATCHWCTNDPLECPDGGYTFHLHCEINSAGKLAVHRRRSDGQENQDGPAVPCGCSVITGSRDGTPYPSEGKCCFPPAPPSPPSPPSPVYHVRWSWDPSIWDPKIDKPQSGNASITSGGHADCTDPTLPTSGLGQQVAKCDAGALFCEVTTGNASNSAGGPSLNAHYKMAGRTTTYSGSPVRSGCSTVADGGTPTPIYGKCCFA